MHTSAQETSVYTERVLSHQTANSHMSGRRWQINDIEINHTRVDYAENGTSVASDNKDLVRLHFTLSGTYNFFHKQLNQSFDIVKGQHNIMCTQGMDLIVKNRSPQIETLGINFPQVMFANFLQDESDELKMFGEQILGGGNIILNQKWHAANPAMQRIIHEILNCQFTGELRKLFLSSKSIELLVVQLDALTCKTNKVNHAIKTTKDKDMIFAARDYLLSRLHQPPSLAEVANHAGTNEYKLKKGFKEMFNQTVLGLLNAHRLDLAYQMIREQQKSASEVAYTLGYSSPQHFSKAFKNKFGIPPMQVKR